MPRYDYECDEGHVFEATQKITDEPLTNCTQRFQVDAITWRVPCWAPVRKLVSKFSFILKGGGWSNSGYGR